MPYFSFSSLDLELDLNLDLTNDYRKRTRNKYPSVCLSFSPSHTRTPISRLLSRFPNPKQLNGQALGLESSSSFYEKYPWG